MKPSIIAFLALCVPQVLGFVPISTCKAVSAFRDTSSVSHAQTFSRRAVILHPTLLVQTSVESSKEAADAFLQEASKAVSKGLGKPESYVMVSHRFATMRFGGTDEPCAFLYLASIGRINKENNSAMAATLSELVGKHFGIKAGRIFIQFVDAEAENFGWNGRTFG